MKFLINFDEPKEQMRVKMWWEAIQIAFSHSNLFSKIAHAIIEIWLHAY